MEKLYTDDVDEAIMLRKKEFEVNNLHTLHIADISVWNRFNRDIRILPDTVVSKPKDSIIQEVFFDALVPEWEPYRVLYTREFIEGQPEILMIQLNLVESDDLITMLARIYFGILLALLVVIFFATRFISNRLWKPFYDTLQKIEAFNIEKHTVPAFSKTRIQEFCQLNAGLEKLINGTMLSYKIQKRFTENASHELQTPLALFQSKLDLLLQETDLSPEQARLIQSLYEASARLCRVNKNLLLLAKIENNQFIDLQPVSLSATIKEVLPYFKEQAEAKRLSLFTNIDSAKTVLEANKGLVEMVINNLLLNAIRHNCQNGTIRITIEGGVLNISNTGSESPLNRDFLFQRFSKLADQPQSNGLGLAIVKEICDRYNWKINYIWVNKMHNFYISF
jgi:signal transduction histidine kinase